ncbi:hypothetical protein JZ751_022792 [Albula glossodonta]|uniref:UBA domain-containing protein n=1 Tax=Albula glossodonta TaxID=121402 RepID=A0A8T2PK30_9TELE|nr:hypothetical protein JZ751_022792 [Albula glossodonta]
MGQTYALPLRTASERAQWAARGTACQLRLQPCPLQLCRLAGRAPGGHTGLFVTRATHTIAMELLRHNNPFSSSCADRARMVADREEDEYQIPSSHPVTLTQPPICISVRIPSRGLESGPFVNGLSDHSTEGKKHKALEYGAHFDSGLFVSGAPRPALCPSLNRTPSDYDILLPPQAEDLFNSAPPSQPPPPPPARHSFAESSSSPSCSRAARPASGHDSFMLSSVATESIQAPARPPKPLPRKTPPDVHHRKAHGHDSAKENVDAKIAKLMGEGYSFEDVKRALMIAQNKVDVARNILREFALVAPRLNL